MVEDRPCPRAIGVKDVAAPAGVSLGTVSNVLNRPDRVAATTRDTGRVGDAPRSASCATSRPGSCAPGRSRAHRLRRARRRQPVLHRRRPGHRGRRRAAGPLGRALQQRRGRRPRARLPRPARGAAGPRHPDHAGRPRRPAARRARRRAASPSCSSTATRAGAAARSVAVDDVLGGRLAVEHLLEPGHQRIAFVGGPTSIGQVRDRHAGARPALAAAGLAPDRLTVSTTAA